MKSILLSLLAIAASAVPGTLLAWWLLAPLGWSAWVLAFCVAPVAMVFSVAIFAGLHRLGQALKFIR